MNYENNSHIGGADRDRTDDLLHAMQALFQLSYGPENRLTNLHRNLVLARKKFGRSEVLSLSLHNRETERFAGGEAGRGSEEGDFFEGVESFLVENRIAASF